MTAAHDGTSATYSIAPICPFCLMSSPNRPSDMGLADVGIAPHPTTTIIERQLRCTATIEATSVGDAGPAITAATLSIS